MELTEHIIPISLARYRTFWQDFFHAPKYFKLKTKFCVSVCKSVRISADAQKKWHTTMKFGSEILEMFLSLRKSLRSDF